jgi:predicted permease
VLVVGLLAVAIAANTAIFSVTDALLFHPYPYPHPERIVILRETLPERTFLTPRQATQRLVEWRRHADVFSAVGGYLQKTVFVIGSGSADQVNTADITVGFLDVLGAKPRWGRSFVSGDEQEGAEFPVLISANLASRYFGDPARALGQVLQATAGRHRVVGVMSKDFAFPSSNYDMWRALDPQGPLTRGFGAIDAMARLAPGVSDDQLARQLAERAPAVGAAIGLPSYAVRAVPTMRLSAGGPRQPLLLVLLGAALCLLLAACANVASLELAAAIARARTSAIHLALGASRAALARVAALEGAMLIGLALAGGMVVIWLSSSVLLGVLPEGLRAGGQHRIGLDARATGYTVVVAAAAWLCAALPPVIAGSRPDLLALLKVEDRTAAASRAGVRLRHVLTAAEIAVAVTLVIVGLLYTRSYRDLLLVEKGFDSAGLAELTYIVPVGHFGSGAERDAAVKRVVADLSSQPGVKGVTQSSAPPALGDSPSRVAPERDGQGPLDKPVFIGAKRVDSAYFSVVRLPLRAGRVFAEGDQPTDVVVTETFAKRFWPNADAIGHAFRLRPTQPWHRVIGVVGDFRSLRTMMPTTADDRVFFYTRWQPPQPPPAAANVTPAPEIDTGGHYQFISLTVRMDSSARARTVLAEARMFDPRLHVTLEMVDDVYAEQNADAHLATQIIGGFSALAFVVAIAGVYGLMTFLVSGRRREIGIRMALGADAEDIRNLILGSSLPLVATGAAAGAVAAVVASRWIESAMFGITATDPATYACVIAVVVGTALAATWHPARQAARLDPAVTLRAE